MRGLIHKYGKHYEIGIPRAQINTNIKNIKTRYRSKKFLFFLIPI